MRSVDLPQALPREVKLAPMPRCLAQSSGWLDRERQ
jgi:hypothetical protein